MVSASSVSVVSKRGKDVVNVRFKSYVSSRHALLASNIVAG